MVHIEELVTLEELQGLGWVTSTQAEEQGVPNYMVYRWGAVLEKHDLARKLPIVYPQGLWVISPEGLAFLKRRKGERGQPPWEDKDDAVGKSQDDSVGAGGGTSALL